MIDSASCQQQKKSLYSFISAFSLGFILVFSWILSPAFSDVVTITTKEVDTTKDHFNDDPQHVNDVQSKSLAKIVFNTEGDLRDSTFQVIVRNGSTESAIEKVRFSTEGPIDFDFIHPVDAFDQDIAGVHLDQGNVNGVWHKSPPDEGFGFNLTPAQHVPEAVDENTPTEKTFYFRVDPSYPILLTYLDFISNIAPYEGDSHKDQQSYVAFEWQNALTEFTRASTGLPIEPLRAHSLFSSMPGDIEIETETELQTIFDATGIETGEHGVTETTVQPYGTLTLKSISTIGEEDDALLRLVKEETFASQAANNINTVGIRVDFGDPNARILLNDAVDDAVLNNLSVDDEVMHLAIKLASDSEFTDLTFGVDWNYGFVGTTDTFYAYLYPGSLTNVPFIGTLNTPNIVLNNAYLFQLDFPHYALTFSTLNYTAFIEKISGNQGVTTLNGGPTAIPEIPSGFMGVFLALTGGFVLLMRQRKITG